MILETEKYPENLIDSGEWGEGVTWEFWRSSESPSDKICSAVALVAIMNLDAGEVVLTKNDRGWEMIAGGIDPGEGPEDTLRREALEEGGFVVVREQIFGYRKIINEGLPGPAAKRSYPPIAYMPYYFAETDSSLLVPTGEEITDSGVFSLEDEATRALLEPGELLLIREGLRAAHEARKN
jgi:8-oxo-dGTP pyrophosphatase MutT (NUDIX family)